MVDTNNVVKLPGDPRPPEPAPPPSRPSRMHGAAIAGMGISAIVGVLAMMALITVTWPDSAARVVIGICVLSGLAFLTFASAAVFSAARDTYRDEKHRKAAD